MFNNRIMLVNKCLFYRKMNLDCVENFDNFVVGIKS